MIADLQFYAQQLAPLVVGGIKRGKNAVDHTLKNAVVSRKMANIKLRVRTYAKK